MYTVTCLYGGTTYTLHDPNTEDLRVYDDEVETEDSAPGAFTFTVSFDHPYLDKIVGLESDIRVYDDGAEIFRGRPISDGEDLYRMRTFRCEGELAFLYDSIQPRRELHNVSPLQFFTLLLNEHNAQVQGKGPIDKTFRLGVVTVIDSNNAIYRYTNRETTLDAIREKLIDRLGGHLCVRVSGGVRYLDLLADVETVAQQPIQLGENLLDYAKDTDYTQIATACIPLGARLDESEIEALDAYLTVASVNGGRDVIQIDTAVQKHGLICKVVEFSDITEPANLKTAGQKWLTDGQYAAMQLTLTAVDLHTLGQNAQPIRKNTQVRVVSSPHGMDRYFEVARRTYHLTRPEEDVVVFGSSGKRSYTSAAKSKISALQTQQQGLQAHITEAIAKERENISNILSLATHGYVALDPNDGPERILIMDTNSVDTAQKIWKWDMNGLGYSSTGIDGPWSIAMTMNGQISADFILAGELNGELIRAGSIMANAIKLFGDLTVYESEGSTTPGGYMGYGKGATDNDTTYGMHLLDATKASEVIVTNAGARMTHGNSSVYVTNGLTQLKGDMINLKSDDGPCYVSYTRNGVERMFDLTTLENTLRTITSSTDTRFIGWEARIRTLEAKVSALERRAGISTQSIRLSSREMVSAWFIITFNWETPGLYYAPQIVYRAWGSGVTTTHGPFMHDISSTTGANPSNPLIFRPIGNYQANGSVCYLPHLAPNTRYDVTSYIYYGSTQSTSSLSRGSTAAANMNFLTYPAQPRNISTRLDLAKRSLTFSWNQPQGGGADMIYNQVRVYLLSNGSLPSSFPGGYRYASDEILTVATGNRLTIQVNPNEELLVYFIPINSASRYDLQNGQFSEESYISTLANFYQFFVPDA